jgi:hypothetical protein
MNLKAIVLQRYERVTTPPATTSSLTSSTYNKFFLKKWPQKRNQLKSIFVHRYNIPHTMVAQIKVLQLREKYYQKKLCSRNTKMSEKKVFSLLNKQTLPKYR